MDLRWMGSKKRGTLYKFLGRTGESSTDEEFRNKDFRPEFQGTKITLQAQLTALKNPFSIQINSSYDKLWPRFLTF
jgi:hypothetical protein